jgi:hypothetical protein
MTMKTQNIENKDGTVVGVFVPIEDWNLMKQRFPNLDSSEDDLPQWQKELLDARLADVYNPDKILPLKDLLLIIDEEI